MRLSAIILQGFKSFRENTRIQINANPVVIVGPNGCGKSNTVDALRWVLGESSARQLRGGTLSDVISNGGGSRPAAAQASVELRFDNSDGSAPGAFAEVAEISVKRSLDRKGDGHYRINGARCRRRDVGDLFLGTGLGSSAYAIVEQGTIGRIIEARPDDLRAMLEEAGGISRYKERRRETAQRMVETREHLQRLRDIHGEMDGRWQRLQQQAEAARKLRALRVEERQWQWWSVAARVQELESEVQGLILRRDVALGQQQSLDEQRLQVEKQLEHLREAARGVQEKLSAAQADLYTVQAELSEAEHQFKESAGHIQRAQTDLTQLGQQQQKIQQERQRQQESETRRQEQLQALLEGQERLTQEEEQTRKARQAAERQAEEQEQLRQQAQQNVADLRRKKEVLLAQLRELEPRVQDMDQRLSRLAQSIPSERPALEAAELRVQQLDEALLTVNARLTSLRKTAEQQQERQQQLREPREQAQSAVQEYRARQKALSSLLQRLQKSRPETLPGQMALMDCLQVQKGWETALERVLQTRLFARVNPAGDATEPSATTLWESSARLDTVAADALLQVLDIPDNLQAGVQDWLRGLRTAPDLSTALSRRQQLQTGEAWITPQGVIVYPLAVVFPEQEDAASLLQCRRELEENEQELAAAETQALATQAALNEAESTLRNVQLSLREKEQEAQKAARELARERELLVRLRSRVETEERQRSERQSEEQRLEAEKAEILARLSQLRQSLSAEEAHWSQEEQALRATQQAAEVDKRRVQELRTAFGRLREQRQQQALQIQKLQTESVAAQQRRDDLQQQEQHLALSRSSKHQDLERLQQQLPGLQANQARIQARRETQRAAVQDQQNFTQTLDQQIRSLEQQRHPLETQLRDLQKNLALTEQEMVAVQVRLEENALRAAELAQQLGENPGPCPDPGALVEQQERIARAIQRLGNVNLAAEEELQELEERRGNLLAQMEDVESALNSLEEAMAAMDQETIARFGDTLQKVNQELQVLFAILFGGGQAALSLLGDDLLDAGLVLRAQPPGKRNASLQQLSGGEKALTAIALVFALFRLNPAPFCVLDEVDAPLDDANVGRFCHLVQEMAAQTQFLIVTHRNLTMQVGEQLIGVTMTEPGISRIVPVSVAATLAATEKSSVPEQQ
ncbi:chromosome segregation protein SMC [Acidithiobacillus marinus]|uniref:Chromosome partition protein Smc n=1 Tax=Acidithiobacillus marinus TaxID=187490 RepID=A0A2I1DJ14_9PROT|nr:chromosome segregation protein SMC [Acidithiobacillus marinus]PKY09857.1 chromosome segregation protein SMC [Acidithiobacillus marinus]